MLPLTRSQGFADGTHRVTGYLSFIHFTAGEGSPTALQGKAMSFIHGVVTVPLKVRIRAGAGAPSREEGQLAHGPVSAQAETPLPSAAMPPQKDEHRTAHSRHACRRRSPGMLCMRGFHCEDVQTAKKPDCSTFPFCQLNMRSSNEIFGAS